MSKFSNSSLEKIKNIDPRLQKILHEAIKVYDFTVLEGIRTPQRQKELFLSGKSKTMNSKHLQGLAVDVAPYPIDWNNHERFYFLAGVIFSVAKSQNTKIRWGGNWDNECSLINKPSFFDAPHFELVE